MTDKIRNILIYLPVLLAILAIISCGSEKAIKKGDQFAAVNEYYEAAKQYKKAYRQIAPKEKAKRAVVAWKLGECYRKSNSAVPAVGAYMNAVRYKYPDSLALRYLADAQLQKGDYKAAIKSYEAYLELNGNDRLAQVGLQAARQSLDWKKTPTRYIVKRSKELNGQRSDYCPMYVGKDTTMIVTTSTRKEAKGEDLSGITGQKFADIFLTRRDDKGKWQRTEIIESEINSDHEDGACAFSPDGRTMYFTRCATDNQSPRYAEIYSSTRSDASWNGAKKVEI